MWNISSFQRSGPSPTRQNEASALRENDTYLCLQNPHPQIVHTECKLNSAYFLKTPVNRTIEDMCQSNNSHSSLPVQLKLVL